jgi:plasmid stabilization system protein ParE
MRLILHPKVSSDINQIINYYKAVAPGLADDFYAELKYFMSEAATKPESFAIRHRDLRRVNLARFPYHFLFRIVTGSVRVLVVRHHRRDPSLGLKRR